MSGVMNTNPVKIIECYVRIDGFVLRVEREGNSLRLEGADEHDRNEMLRYFVSAIHNHELAENLRAFKRVNESGVLWYYVIPKEEYAKYSMVVEFARVGQDYEHARGLKMDEPVWTYKFVPTMLHSTFMAHNTLEKLIAVSEAVADGHTRFPEGVEVYSEDDWAIKFDHAGKKGLLLPSLLGRLEQAAYRYVQLFEHHARDFTPDDAEFWRRSLLKELDAADLVNATIAPVVFEQFKKYRCLARCVNAAEYLRSYLDIDEKGLRLQDHAVGLDWMMFEPYFPEGVEEWDALQHCIDVVAVANLEVPRTLPTQIGNEPYRLVTGWDDGRIKLLHALPISLNGPHFNDVYKPSYLELVEWAALKRQGSPAMEWDVVVNWDERLDTLADLASDPTLPEADYLHHCIYCHLAGLRVHEPRKMLSLAEGLAKHANPAIRRIVERTRALTKGELAFVYDDW